MGVINNNKYMLDRPMWEQLSFAPVPGIAGSCNCDDNRRFIYNYLQTSEIGRASCRERVSTFV